MRSDNFLKAFFPIPDSEEEMEVALSYAEGGMCYMNGSNQRRGLWIHFTPVKRSEGCVSRMLMDDRGRKVLMQEMQRRSKPKGYALADSLDDILKPAAEAAIAQDWPGVVALLKPAQVGDV